MNFIEFIQFIGGGVIRAAREATPLILEGLKLTFLVSVLAIVFGVVIGLITCLFKLSRFGILRGIASTYIWIIRGTPMIVQAFFTFFGLSVLIRSFFPEFIFTPLQAAVIVASLNAGAYLAEVFRSGIAAVPKGQTEAARSLGLSHGKTMRKIILPQAIKITIPSMVNQFIITVKDTSILSVIGLAEMTNRGRAYIGASFNTLGGWFYVAVFYLALISVLMLISMKVEAKFAYDRKN